MPVGATGVRSILSGDNPVRRDFVELTDFERNVIDQGSAVLVPSGSGKLPESGEYRDLIAVPIQLGDIGWGVVIVANHSVESETFDSEDLRLFEALAANLSTALTSSQRLDRLRLEVAAREHQALHDSLTGLANRTLFAQWVLDRRSTGAATTSWSPSCSWTSTASRTSTTPSATTPATPS